MANTKSAQKAMRQAERRVLRNQSARSTVRTYVKKAGAAVAGTVEDAATIVREAVRALDKAAQKGIIHRNAAARRKSKLMSRLHGLSAAAAPAETAAVAPKTTTRRASAAKSTAGAKKSTSTTRRTTTTRRTSTKSS